jgi:hypothetical protein
VRPDLPRALIDEPFAFVRESCARVAERGMNVRIDRARLLEWCEALPLGAVSEPASVVPAPIASDEELACAFVLQLDAINFGSGWFPLLRKRPGMSGYRTVEAAFVEQGPLDVERLARIDAEATARLFGQGAEAHELMELFAQAWNALGERVFREHAGSFARMVASAGGSSESLVRELLQMPFYRDVAEHEGEPVAFLKRAQITVSDLAALPGLDLGELRELTIFADNLVPHVLRLDGVLEFAPGLVERIERGQPLEASSAEEVEIRACAVAAVEESVALLSGAVSARQLDAWLWTRGGGAGYKAHPRHRARCVYY